VSAVAANCVDTTVEELKLAPTVIVNALAPSFQFNRANDAVGVLRIGIFKGIATRQLVVLIAKP
jgi:hypothetical protein